MRIYTKAGDLAFSSFTFPDGQPHLSVDTHEIEFRSVTVETAIRNPTELLQTLLVSQVLRQQGYSEVNLDIRYLLGARMDRAIGENQPFTLECVARVINGAGFSRVRILDAHSEAATRLIRNSENVLPRAAFSQVVAKALWGQDAGLVVPDKGASDRVYELARPWGVRILHGYKTRNQQTGALTGFGIEEPSAVKGERTGSSWLIVDDICDGGGTFVGLAKELRRHGAKHVYLFVTHGIFSKGIPLDGIDHIYCTNSFETAPLGSPSPYLTVVPIFMKDIP